MFGRTCSLVKVPYTIITYTTLWPSHSPRCLLTVNSRLVSFTASLHSPKGRQLSLINSLALGDGASCEIVKIMINDERRIYVSINLPSLVQTMACRLAAAKPLSEPMPEYC